MRLEHIEILMKNPYRASEILTHFASGYGQEFIPIHLFYLVLPLVYYAPSRSVFGSVNNTNRLFSVLKQNKEITVDFQRRVASVKELTNLSLIVAHNNKYLNIGASVELATSLDYNKSIPENKELDRAAFYFGLLAGYERSYIHVFKHFKALPK